MIKEAIILAGGFGTRLQSVISDVPKCLAPVAGKPFLHYLLYFLKESGIERFIFSIGFKHEQIEQYLIENHPQLNYTLSLENKPLGTGGAIQLGLLKCSHKNVVVCNGDTLYKVDISLLNKFHETKKATCTLCLKPMYNFDRYGVVELNEDKTVRAFKEKQFYISGLINGGLYALNVEKFLKENLPEIFSFEKNYLEVKINTTNKKSNIYGIIADKYFIDIGIPEDFQKAQIELKK